MKDLTQGPIAKGLVLFTLPMIAGNLIQTLYNVVDTLFVGRLGGSAVAATSLSFSVIFVLTSLALGLSQGIAILVSQAAGAKDYDQIKRIIQTSFTFSQGITLLISGIGVLSSNWILSLLGAPAEAFYPALLYLRIFLLGLPLMSLTFLCMAIFRGLGDGKTPLKFLSLAMILNILLDPLLIFGFGIFPRLEVAGAALATVIAQFAGSIFALVLMQRYAEYTRLSLTPSFDLGIIKNIIRLGVPAGISQTIMALGSMLVIRIVASFGTNPLAGFAIGRKIDSFLLVLINSLGLATTAMVGQNIGAKEYVRVKKILQVACQLTLLLTATGVLFFQLFPESLMRLFTPDKQVLGYGVQYLRIVSLGHLGLCLTFMLGCVLKGAGNMLPPTLIQILSAACLRIPIAFVLSKTYGVQGVFFAIVISNYLGTLLILAYMRNASWMEKTPKRLSASP